VEKMLSSDGSGEVISESPKSDFSERQSKVWEEEIELPKKEKTKAENPWDEEEGCIK